MNNCIFPQFGRVAIVDDEYEQVREVQTVLAKNGIPYIFYDYSSINDWELEKVYGIRLLFLDIRLEEGVNDSKTMGSILVSTIDNIIPVNNGPYIIILWTNEYALYSEISKYLISNLDNSITTKPVFIGALDKKDFTSKPMELKQAIEEFYKNENMIAFLNIIENETMIIPQNVMKFIVHDIIRDFDNKKLNDLFLRIACNESVEGGKLSATTNVLKFYSDIIRDRYMEIIASTNVINKLSNLWDFDFDNKKNVENIRNKFDVFQDAIINTVLNINIHADRTDNLPGKVYEQSNESISINLDILKSSTFEREIDLPDVPHEIIPIEVDITPSCDYANDKNHMLRTVYGYACLFSKCDDGNWKELKYSKKVKNFVGYDYVYITPSFIYDNRICVLALNTKFMGLEDKQFGDNLKYYFRLNDELCNEVRKKTGEVISRLGINQL